MCLAMRPTPKCHFVSDSQVGVSKFLRLGLPQLWWPIILCVNFWLKWGLKQSYSSRRDLFNGMSYATWTQRNQGNSWLLVAGSQIVNFISNPSFGHNLCFKCSNGSREPILDIYVPRSFQWYKEFFSPMSFDPYNYPLKVWESIGTLIPKVGTHLGVWGSFLQTLLHSREHEMWLPGFTFGSQAL